MIGPESTSPAFGFFASARHKPGQRLVLSTSLNCILDSQSDFCENNIGYNHDIASISTGKAHACITATNKNSNGGQNDVFCFGNNNKQQTVSSDVSFYGNESGHMGEDLKALELERYCKSNPGHEGECSKAVVAAVEC